MRRSRVLFVCIGNACRSQIAEGFARAYGSDVIDPESAGVAPVSRIPDVTHKMMGEKGIDLAVQYPKSLEEVHLHDVDLAVNLSGLSLRGLPVPHLREWEVKDPMGSKESVHREVRDEIERRVMQLILEFRQQRASAAKPPKQERI